MNRLKDKLLVLRKNKIYWVLIALMIAGFILVFWNYPYRYYLDDETIRDAVVGIEGARELQVPLIGPFSSAGPFTFGPWYHYQLILFSVIVPISHSPWVYLSLAYLASILILYKIGDYLKDKLFGIILATLGTFSPALVIGGTHLTNPNLLTVFALLSVLLFLKLVKKDVSYWWSFVFGIVLGIAINTHYQSLSLLILPLILLFVKKKKFFYVLACAVGLAITFVPMLFFDLTNHWFNFKNITYYYLHGKDVIYVPNRWLFYVRDFWPSLWGDVIGVPSIIAFCTMAIFGLIALYEIYRKKMSKELLFLIIAFAVIFVGLRYYWGERFFGYFNFTRPFILIFTGYTLYFIGKFKFGKFLVLGGVVLIVLFGIPANSSHIGRDAFTVDMYNRVKVLEEKYPNQKFRVYICSIEYQGHFAKYPKSILYLLEEKSKIGEKGVKIGFSGVCGDESDKRLTSVGSTSILDLSGLSDKDIKENGWKTLSFRSIYDSTAKWWFDERP